MLTTEEEAILTKLTEAFEAYGELPQPTIGVDEERALFQAGVEQARQALYARLGRRAHQNGIHVDYLEERVAEKRRELSDLEEETQRGQPLPEGGR